MAWVAGCVSKWFTRPNTVTNPSTNRARCRVTSLIHPTPLPLSHADTATVRRALADAFFDGFFKSPWILNDIVFLLNQFIAIRLKMNNRPIEDKKFSECNDYSSTVIEFGYLFETRMWANAQRDGRPAEYRWRPLFNAAKFG